MGTLHTRPVSRDFTGDGFLAVMLQLISIGVGWVVPFFLAFMTGYFWMKEFTYWEQAKILELNKAIIEVNGYEGSNNRETTNYYQWTAIPAAQHLAGDHLIPISYTAYSEDIDSDDVFDIITIQGAIPLPDYFRLTSFDAAVFFQWNLEDIIKLEMETVCRLRHDSQYPIISVSGDGVLEFRQRGPLLLSPFVDYDEIYNISRLRPEDMKSPEDILVSTITSIYESRNESTVYSANIVSTPDRTPLPSLRTFEFSFVIRNPKQPITHTADLPQTLKFGFLQYFALWYVFTWIMSIIKMVAVEHQYTQDAL
eukprot:TRINITY_DN3922_c0_g1_i1.p1 TRINITY_DN3922_c0_g1~~TRINITY_DN3922_c0_g1_i1.p1  ORF type:complete len:310 (+),score=39.51 TRINITY_DN3922_c0_g1_i1:93-1022(+)